jgi:6,7-dimethyl-8-ribityllumazine synthase
VPGALEIPHVLNFAAASGLFGGGAAAEVFHGAIALGCVIRGETSHYEIVANGSAEMLMQIAATHQLAVGNGILTVENEAQALERASVSGQNKGADAARACLRLVEIQRDFQRRR